MLDVIAAFFLEVGVIARSAKARTKITLTSYPTVKSRIAITTIALENIIISIEIAGHAR
jgi:hypothetical protein